MEEGLVESDELAAATVFDALYDGGVFLCFHLRVIGDVWEAHLEGVCCGEGSNSLRWNFCNGWVGEIERKDMHLADVRRLFISRIMLPSEVALVDWSPVISIAHDGRAG